MFLHAACDSRRLDLPRSASSLSDKISPLQWFSLERVLKYLQFMQGRHNIKRRFLPSSNQSCQDDLKLLPQIYPSNPNMRAGSVTYSARISCAEPEKEGQMTASGRQSRLLHDRQLHFSLCKMKILENWLICLAAEGLSGETQVFTQSWGSFVL